MALVSKYSNEQVEALVNGVLQHLEQQEAPLDLSIMVLGNSISHLLNTRVAAEQRQALAQQFAQALQQSLSDN
ncbi:DUF1414 domain-containing protein [Paraferrimonas sedimenticola]|uniref:UPF0352 protein GCM10007895_32960 n=1 Tax=Paraferrimonas sedimenticola TaxID=375674 RepID=A0AA37W0K0_9GAMM|nr:DUF1414 domain-containing protein [Paraferrimonas sedimenticola]GLP97989.1 UPF0352 protein [Paraferrimonas sedimenticola]